MHRVGGASEKPLPELTPKWIRIRPVLAGPELSCREAEYDERAAWTSSLTLVSVDVGAQGGIG